MNLSEQLALEFPQRVAVIDAQIAALQAEREALMGALPHLRGTGKVRQSQARGRRVRRAATRGGKHA